MITWSDYSVKFVPFKGSRIRNTSGDSCYIHVCVHIKQQNNIQNHQHQGHKRKWGERDTNKIKGYIPVTQKNNVKIIEGNENNEEKIPAQLQVQLKWRQNKLLMTILTILKTPGGSSLCTETPLKNRVGSFDDGNPCLVLSSARVTELGSKPGEDELLFLNWFWWQKTEEGMMFDTCLPQSFSCSMICQFKANRRLKLFKLSRSDLNVELVPFVGNLKNFGPSKSIDPQSVLVNQETRSTDSHHDVKSCRIFGWMCFHSIHCKFLCIFKVM